MSEGRPTGDDVIIGDHVEGELKGRGWTEGEVRDLTTTDQTGSSVDQRHRPDGEIESDTATVYGSKEGYVVVNDRTGEVVQVSNKNNPNFRPDDRIKWRDSRE